MNAGSVGSIGADGMMIGGAAGDGADLDDMDNPAGGGMLLVVVVVVLVVVVLVVVVLLLLYTSCPHTSCSCTLSSPY